MSSKSKAVLIAGLTAAITAVSSLPAHAGTYTSWACRTPQGGVAAVGDANHGWRPSTTGHWGAQAENRCATDGYLLARLGNYSYPWASAARWFYNAPPNTQITAFEIYWSGFAGGTFGSTPWAGDVKMWRSDQPDPNYVRRHYGVGAFGSSTPLATSNRVAQSGLAVNALHTEAGCSPGGGGGGSECPPSGSGETSMLRIYRSKITLSDSTAPALGSISGDSLSEGTFEGNEVISLSATDTGSGVYRLIVNVDGDDLISEVINPDGGRCVDVDPSNADPYEFVQPQPCPLSNAGEVTIDTRLIPEGEHTLRLKVEDASGNKVTVWGPSKKTIDNVPPPRPVDPDGEGPESGGPTLTGVPKEGNTLVADPGSWSGADVTFAYRWERCDAAGANCQAIDGATSRTHTLGSGDVGKRVRVVVTATNPEGATDAASAVTDPVLAAGCTSGCAAPSTAGPSASDAGGPFNGIGASPNGRVSATYGGERVVKTVWGKRIAITGKLVNENGSPITGAVVDVLERARGGNAFGVVATVVTASDGTFAYLVPVGASRMLRFAYRYRSAAADYAHTTDVEMLVRAKVRMRATRRVSGSRPLHFRGRIPAAVEGSFVLLQARVGSRWQIFEKARIRRNGKFHAKYVFRRTHVPTTFRFRALFAGKDASNLERARSRTAKVRYTP